jgi:hypothetical protein
VNTTHECGGTGYTPVTSELTCVLTRFQLRSVWGLISGYRLFKVVDAHARSCKGLVVSKFLVESPRVFWTMSIWETERAILEFNSNVTTHVYAANKSFGLLEFSDGKPLLWSAQFHLSRVSPSNFRWKNCEFGGIPATEARG